MGMSIDEAKRRLLEVKACLHSLTEENQKDHEAFDMAIEALEQEPTTKNDLEVDCISRADAIKAMQDKAKELKNEDTINGLCGSVAILFDMPPVTPQEPRKGHWEVVSDGYGDNAYICECSECKDTVWVYKDADRKWNYCPNCGAKMVEPQERSDKE